MRTKDFERYRITSSIHTILQQNNRPLYRNKGLKHRKPEWKVIEGESKNEALLKIIIAELKRWIGMES